MLCRGVVRCATSTYVKNNYAGVVCALKDASMFGGCLLLCRVVVCAPCAHRVSKPRCFVVFRVD